MCLRYDRQVMSAKYYIYRNLNRGNAFSVKHRGKVVDYLEGFEADDVEFRVSEAGNRRAKTTKKRNVHAFIVCDDYTKRDDIPLGELTTMTPVTYNPFLAPTFFKRTNTMPVSSAKRVVCYNGKAYIKE